MKDKISVLFIGDIVGASGITAVRDWLPELKERYQPDFMIANGENADKGKGMTKREAKELFDMELDVITTGNHIWDNWYSKPLLAENPKVLRPFNYPAGNVGMGYTISEIDEEISICVLNIQGRTFMQSIDCPFKAADFVIKTVSEQTKIIIVDFHADATAEKIAMSWYLDGRVSALIGTHTHIPTADASILPQGMAYITDVGMTGPFDSVVGMRKDQALKRFLLQIPHKYEVATEDNRICGVNLIIDTATGMAEKIEQFILPGFENGVLK
ncbi:TIGR00282 family metallophosphoesterase [Bacteroidota bacterium]